MAQTFTFGAGHVDPISGAPLLDHYVQAPDGYDAREARIWMVERYGQNWSAQYDSPEHAGNSRYSLVEWKAHEPYFCDDLAVRLALGARYFSWEYWHYVAGSAAKALEEGRPPAEVAEKLKAGWV